jgi:hypothetical protein
VNRSATGVVVLLAALAMMLGLLGGEVSELHRWADALSTAFVGKVLGHIAAILTAYISGQLVPTNERLISKE